MITCNFCKSSEKIVKCGFRNNASGKKQKYQCNVCHRLFVPDDGFWKMKHRPEIIAEALSCKKRGMPYEEVSRHFKEYDKANVSGVTVFNWVKKYGEKVDAFNKKQVPKLSGKINADEFVFKVKKK
jgi:transposase-like protein